MESITRPVFLPVILGTSRQGRASEHAARFVFEEVSKRPDMETELIDIRNLRLSIDDAGEAIKDSQFSATVNRADGLILVVPEYNHSFPGLLKHVLDTNLKEYIHKAVGVCGVSAGPFGGARMIQSLLPVLRELGLVTIFWDVYFGTAGKLFDPATGNITDPAYSRAGEEIRRRAGLDGAGSAFRAREYSGLVAGGVGLGRFADGRYVRAPQAGLRRRRLQLDQQHVVPVRVAAPERREKNRASLSARP